MNNVSRGRIRAYYICLKDAEDMKGNMKIAFFEVTGRSNSQETFCSDGTKRKLWKVRLKQLQDLHERACRLGDIHFDTWVSRGSMSAPPSPFLGPEYLERVEMKVAPRRLKCMIRLGSSGKSMTAPELREFLERGRKRRGVGPL